MSLSLTGDELRISFSFVYSPLSSSCFVYLFCALTLLSFVLASPRSSAVCSLPLLMSAGEGAATSSSKAMGFVDTKEAGENSGVFETKTAENVGEDSDDDYEAVGREEQEDFDRKLQLGPRFSLKEHLEKDKEDDSLRRWKEKLLGSVDFDNIGDVECLEPEVKFLSLSIVSPGRPDIILPVPNSGNPNGLWFTLKEGSPYSLKFSFLVSNNLVSGLKYTNTVWKTGIKVDSMKEMLGTFSPQPEAYTHVMQEETTPSGILARGSYSAKSKFVDDDNKCHLEISYTFDIQKEWRDL